MLICCSRRTNSGSMSGFDKGLFNLLVEDCGALMESHDWDDSLAPENLPEGCKLVLGEGQTITVDLGCGLHHGRYVSHPPAGALIAHTEGTQLKRPVLSRSGKEMTPTVTMRSDWNTGRHVCYRRRNRELTVKGPETAAGLLMQIGDAVRFESYRNLLLEDMISDPANERMSNRYISLFARPDCPVLDAAPLPDPTAGRSTKEVVALVGDDVDPTDGGCTTFEGLKEESPGHFVCLWSEPFC
jgi:hypothetical protein